MKNRRILCMTALMLAMLLAMGGCKQAEAKETSTQPVEQVEETEETTEEPTIGESTEEELKAEAEAKAKAEAEAAAKAEAEKKAAEEAAKAEAEKKAAEEAAKKEQETQQSQSKPDSSQSQTSTPESKPAESKPDTNTSTSSGGYAVNSYGNPSNDIITAGLVDTINPADPQLDSIVRRNSPGYHGSTPIPNPYAKVDPISPFKGMSNPPADWPKPQPNGFGEYKWDSETGCWRYYNDGRASKYYLSLYGVKTNRSSEARQQLGSDYDSYSAFNRGVY